MQQGKIDISQFDMILDSGAPKDLCPGQRPVSGQKLGGGW